jgi:hypothetical protein
LRLLKDGNLTLFNTVADIYTTRSSLLVPATSPSRTPYHDQTKSKQSANHPHTAKHPRTKKANPVKSWLFLVLKFYFRGLYLDLDS